MQHSHYTTHEHFNLTLQYAPVLPPMSRPAFILVRLNSTSSYMQKLPTVHGCRSETRTKHCTAQIRTQKHGDITGQAT